MHYVSSKFMGHNMVSLRCKGDVDATCNATLLSVEIVIDMLLNSNTTFGNARGKVGVNILNICATRG